MTNRKLFALAPLWVSAILLGIVPLHAQREISLPAPQVPDLAMPQDREVVIEMPEMERRETVVARDDETISVDFPDEEVRVIIRSVADLYDLNVVIPDQLVGNVSIKLRNVTWRQVFDVVLDPLGYTWIEDRNIIRIKSRDELVQEPVDTRVFVINFARANELQASISPMVDTAIGGRIQVDARSNALVITERPTRMNQIQEIIERLDRATDQVMIESKFVEITARNSRDVGINWSPLAGYQVGASQMSREWTRDSQAEATRESVPFQQSQDTTTVTPPSGVPATTQTFTQGASETFDMMRSLAQGRTDQAIFNANAFNLVLSALQTDSNVEVVSNPTVVTMNNTAAEINIGEEYPVPQFSYNQQQGVFEVSGFEFKPIGILLNVTPQVNAAGFITLSIRPEISLRTDAVSFGSAGASIPIISTRRTESTVTIKSGFTLAIGGLIENATTKGETKVPILGDIPLMGRLFRSDTQDIEKRNLIIFITAKVLNPDGSTYRDVFSQRTLHEMGIRSRDVPGYEPTEEEDELYQRLQDARDAVERVQAESMLRQQLQALEEAGDRAAERAERPETSEPRRGPRRNQP